MSGIYIPDVGLPQDGDFELWVSIKKDGSYNYNISGLWNKGERKAVPVPPHGDLIDRDALLDTATIHWSQTTNESCFPIDEIEYAPIIIPADGKDIKVPTREDGE